MTFVATPSGWLKPGPEGRYPPKKTSQNPSGQNRIVNSPCRATSWMYSLRGVWKNCSYW